MTFLFLGLACLLSLFMVIALDMLSFTLGRKGWRRFVSTFLLFYSQVVGTEFLLGLTSFLYDYSLAAVNIALTMALIIALRKMYGQKIFRKYLNNLKTIPDLFRKVIKRDPLLVLLGTLIGLLLVWIVFLSILFPPLDWDGNAHHLPYAAELVQNHHIFDVAASMPWLTGYPKGGELIQAWTILLAHNDTIVELTQLPFLFLGIFALYGVARTLGVEEKNARLAALLFAFTPMVINQLPTGYIDVMLCTIFFAALALVIQKSYTKLDFILVGIAFALIVSIKASGIYFIAALLPLFLWNLYKLKGFRLKEYVFPFFALAVPMVFGLYWYVKNLIMYDSPLYPFGYKIGDVTLFKGLDFAQWSEAIGASMPDNTFARLWYTWSEHIPDPTQFQYDYSSNYFGLGIIWFIVLVPAFMVSIYFALKQRQFYLLTILGLLSGLLMVFPTNFSPRYTIFILSIGVIGLGVVLNNLSYYGAYITKAIITVLAVITLIANICVWSYAPGVVENQLESITSKNGLRGPGTVFAINMGGAYEVARRAAQQDETIVYTSGNWIYPLWNNNFSNRVVYVDAQDKNTWYKQVMAEGADYIFTTNDKNLSQNQWAADVFKNIMYKDARYTIYEVN